MLEEAENLFNHFKDDIDLVNKNSYKNYLFTNKLNYFTTQVVSHFFKKHRVFQVGRKNIVIFPDEYNYTKYLGNLPLPYNLRNSTIKTFLLPAKDNSKNKYSGEIWHLSKIEIDWLQYDKNVNILVIQGILKNNESFKEMDILLKNIFRNPTIHYGILYDENDSNYKHSNKICLEEYDVQLYYKTNEHNLNKYNIRIYNMIDELLEYWINTPRKEEEQ